MPPLLAAAAVAAGGAIIGGKMQSNAASNAAKAHTRSANYAADKQDEASQRTEAFLREQAQAGWRDSEATRKANYDQWAAQQRRVSNYAAGLGYGAHEIPDYVPGVDPGFQGGQPQTGVPQPRPTPPLHPAAGPVPRPGPSQGSVGAMLAPPPTSGTGPVVGPDGQMYDRRTGQRLSGARPDLRGTQGSVGSYLRRTA